MSELDVPDVDVRKYTANHLGTEFGVAHNFAEEKIICESQILPPL